MKKGIICYRTVLMHRGGTKGERRGEKSVREGEGEKQRNKIIRVLYHSIIFLLLFLTFILLFLQRSPFFLHSFLPFFLPSFLDFCHGNVHLSTPPKVSFKGREVG